MPDVALTAAAVVVGTWEKGGYRGQRVAPVVTPVVNNGLDVAGAQVTRPAGRAWRSFRFLRYSSRDLESHWRSPRAAALACHRFVTMECIVSTGEPVERITS